jgi:integrase
MPAEDPSSLKPSSAAKRRYGTGSIFEKRNARYGQWRVRNRTITRKLGPIRTPGSRDGLTRKMAEARLGRVMAEVTVTPLFERMTVEEAGARLIQQLVTKGRKPSTTAGYESYLRVHVAPFFGEKSIGDITKADIEEFVAVCLDNDQSVKSTRNYLGFLHSIFDFALRKGWVIANPCKSVEKPEVSDQDQDIRFLDQAELDALLAVTGGPRSRRRAGTADRARRVRRLRDGERLPWKAIAAEFGVVESSAIYLYGLDLDETGLDDPLSTVERVLYLTAAMTGMRQGELLALRWMDVDWTAHRVQVRRIFVRGPVRDTEVEALLAEHPTRRRRRPRARAAVPGLELPVGRGSRVRPSAHRQTHGPLAAAQAVQGSLEARQRPRSQVPRLEAYVRHENGRCGRPDAHSPGVDGAPRLQDDADLCRLRAGGERGRTRQCRLRPRSVHQFVHQSEQKWG